MQFSHIGSVITAKTTIGSPQGINEELSVGLTPASGPIGLFAVHPVSMINANV